MPNKNEDGGALHFVMLYSQKLDGRGIVIRSNAIRPRDIVEDAIAGTDMGAGFEVFTFEDMTGSEVIALVPKDMPDEEREHIPEAYEMGEVCRWYVAYTRSLAVGAWFYLPF